MDSMTARKDLENIFMAGVSRVDPYRLIQDSVSVKKEQLVVDSDDISNSFDLSRFKQVFIAGFGKATAKMAKAVEEILGDCISEGVISVKYGHTEPLSRIRTIEAGHPVPDENGLLAARVIAELASRADEQTLFITLISGGGSALIPYPLEISGDFGSISLSLAEKQEVTRILLGCGATIHELNTVRKHMSSIKGGRLAALIAPGTSLSLILSDVVGDNLDVIASGATSPDSSTFTDVKSVFEKYNIFEQIPENARKILSLGLENQIPETPKPADPVLSKAYNLLIGTNTIALHACMRDAKNKGYDTHIITSQLTGEAREVAADLYATAKKLLQQKQSGQKSICLLFGGETTVTIRGSGKGGRNQEMALAFLSEMESDPSASDHISFLSGGTDGNDGPTDAAGAFADKELLGRVEKKELSIDKFLNNNDAYYFFDLIGGLLKTGPTNTNVCDIQAILIG